jgi:PKD repeat protein
MKRVLSSLLLGLSMSAYCQNVDWCASDRMFKKALDNNPQMQIEFDDFNQWMVENNDQLGAERGGVKIIPVVVHIIHNYGAENITDARVADAIRYLNEDFLGTSADLADVVAPFTSLINNPQLEFRLATLDPNGNCTNGITRTQSTLTYDADDASKLVVWPRNKYYNIWVVFNIYSDTPGTVTAGYSYLPSNFTDASVDGTIIGYNYMGVTGSNFAKRVLSHETGHWFRLAHTFGYVQVDQGDCSGTDNVSDTPPTVGSFSNCNLNRAECGSQANVQNIMDYASCTNMFTTGQANRMIGATNSATAERNNLWTNTNLTATGTLTLAVPNCAPIADFHANRYSVCTGTTITFYDDSYNATATSWLWTFTDGITTITDTNQIAIVTFNTAGSYDVTLTASSPAGNGSVTRNNYVYVYDATAQVTPAPFSEDFENNPISSGLWSVLYNPDPADGWRVTNSAFVSSNTSIMVHNFSLAAGQTHTIISPSYDFTTTGGPISMTFKYAYARRNADNEDVLKLYGTTNCGQTWQLRATFDATSLATGGVKTTDWFPNSGQWGTKTVATLSSYLNKPNVRFKFEFVTDGGNNLFIEDINITGPVGLEDAANNDLSMNIYPNPAQQEINVDFYADKDYSALFRLVDIAGKQLSVLGVKELVQGENHVVFTIPAGTTQGLYFLQMEAGGKVFTQKIIIE